MSPQNRTSLLKLFLWLLSVLVVAILLTQFPTIRSSFLSIFTQVGALNNPGPTDYIFKGVMALIAIIFGVSAITVLYGSSQSRNVRSLIHALAQLFLAVGALLAFFANYNIFPFIFMLIGLVGLIVTRNHQKASASSSHEAMGTEEELD